MPTLALIVATTSSAFLTGCGAFLGDETKSDLVDQPKAGAMPTAWQAATLPNPQYVAGARSADTLVTSALAKDVGYRIGPQDVLEVSVFKVPELSKTVQVSDDGVINLPLVGQLSTKGQTTQDLEGQLVQRLGAKYLRDPQVSVFVKEYNSQRVTVEGAVKKPGVYPLRGETTLLQFIATAQGLEATADSTAIVFRKASGKRTSATYDIDEIRAGNTEDPIIRSGDVIVAGTSFVKETFNNVLRALPAAGVLTPLL